MSKNVFLIISILLISTSAHSQSTSASIAEEYFADGNYLKAISKCKTAIKDNPGDLECKNLIEKSQAIIDKNAAANRIKDEKQKAAWAAKTAERKRKHGSPECIKATALVEYCKLIVAIETENAIIARENRIARDTGSANLATLNKAGRDKTYLEDRASAMARRSGLEPSMCKLNRDDYGFPRVEIKHQQRELTSACGNDN